MPVLRYFMVMGCCLLGLLFAADYLAPKEATSAPAVAATVSDGGSLASWRHSQENLSKSQVAAVVYPDVAPMAPTAERLQWERQMTFRRDAPVQEAKSEPAAKSDPVYEAKAEMADITPAAKIPAKPVVKMPARPKTVARIDRRDNRPNFAVAIGASPAPPFGGFRQAQYDRPGNGWVTGFRMF
jgi:hypothetical protein